MLPLRAGSELCVHDPIVLTIAESSQAGEARRIAVARAGHLGFSETERGKVALVVTEAARNLVAHARGGELLLRSLPGDSPGIELLALDKGPGMADIGRCLRDGYSTAGTPGGGLGAIRRLSGQFDLFSLPGVGTALLARLWARPARQPRRPGLRIGAVCLPHAGEAVCGDAWAVEQSAPRSQLLVVDGLGHGPPAAAAAGAALETFYRHPALDPHSLIERAHLALHGTRGAAIAAAALDGAQRTLRFAGVGNIAGRILTPEDSSGLVSHNGTVGHRLHKIQEFEHPWPDGALLVLHSDGLETRWDLARYPGLITRDPSVIAGVLYRDFRRGRDDVTVLVAREAGPGACVP